MTRLRFVARRLLRRIFIVLIMTTVVGVILLSIGPQKHKKFVFRFFKRLFGMCRVHMARKNLTTGNCEIPHLNPFHADVLPFYKTSSVEPCAMKKYAVVRDGVLQFKPENIEKALLYYIIRLDDFNFMLSEPHVVATEEELAEKKKKGVDIHYPLKEDFFKLELVLNGAPHEEYHAAIARPLSPSPSPTSHTTASQHKSNSDGQPPLNIMMIMFDSVSNANAQRNLQKSYRYLRDDPNTFIFKGQSIVGDGTTAQLCAMLTGIPEHEQPEARKGQQGAQPCDRWEWIWNDLHERGYKTLYSEDDPTISTFHYRLLGFKDIPTTKYLRPFWLAIEKSIKKHSHICGYQMAFDYLKRFYMTYKQESKFALVVNSKLSHFDINDVGAADEDILDMYKFLSTSGFSNNTVVILFGDHGNRFGDLRSTLQGKLEERLPFMSITLPAWFQSYTAHMKNMKENAQNVMTSHFDVYATLQHLITWPHYPEQNQKIKRKFGRSLFSNIKHLNRTCDQAGVDRHWCTCLESENVNAAADRAVLKIIDSVLRYINNLNEKDARGKCSKLTLRKVLRASHKIPNLEVRQFSKTRKNQVCDSCGVTYVTYRPCLELMQYTYEITFSVSPSGGIYEVTRECLVESDGSIFITDSDTDSKDISRTNLYGSQPECVAKRLPHLRKYCHCKDVST